MSKIVSLANQLFDAVKAVVNSEKKLGIKMREVYNLLVSVGFTLSHDSKVVNFKDVVELYTKSTNTDLLELYTKLQDKLRLKAEGKTDEIRADAKVTLEKLNSQWASLCRHEISKLRDAQSKAGKEVAATNKEIAKAAGEAVEKLLAAFAADPTKLSDEEKATAEQLSTVKTIICSMPDDVVLGIRQITFKVMADRKKAAEEAAKAAPSIEKVA